MKWGNWLIGACCALFVAVIVTPTGLYDGVWKLATGKDAAAWAQAIGSFLAVMAAIAVAVWEGGRVRRVEREARRQLRGKALVLSRAFVTAFEVAAINTGAIALPEYYAVEEVNDASVELSLKVLANALATFPAEALDTPAAMSAMLRLASIAEIATANTDALRLARKVGMQHAAARMGIQDGLLLAQGHDIELARLLG
jgi:hypothetical protein